MQITQILTHSERYLMLNLIKCNADLLCICSYSMIPLIVLLFDILYFT